MSKWYSNLYAFKLNTKITKESFDKIEDFRMPVCGPEDKEVLGWNEIFESEGLINELSPQIYQLKLRIDKKNIPASTIKNKVNERIKKLKEQGVDKINKKELKEQVEAELTRIAFVVSKEIFGYIDNKNKLLVINSNSSKDIDLFVDLLRNSVKELDIDMLEIDFDITEILTEWLQEKSAKDPFVLGDNCVLTDSVGGSKASLSQQDLTTEEIDILINSGKKVSEVNLSWEERVSFSLNNKFQIKKIKPLPVIGELIKEEIGEDEDEHTAYIASMLIMVSDFAQLIKDLCENKE